ncbi:MAG TPA: FkbM family methyltransferase [Pyrinomonadaceae bacterium]|nr:FkbM family methyltransferase [Pyrinomonadaceae bacterium]
MLRQPLRLIPNETPMVILQGRLRGKRWLAGSHTHGCWLGSYENQKRLAIERVLTEGSTFLDVGANAGFYTLLASVIVGPTGRVIAFEPLPTNLDYLRKHLRLNSTTNVTVVEAAVSDRSGAASFDAGPTSAMGHLSSEGTLQVETVSLDDLLSKNRIPPPDCIKIDVEGGEALVLQGARWILENVKPTIFLSTHGTELHRECCALLRAYDYELTAIDNSDGEQSDEIIAVFGSKSG